jgi:hypothetical protein
MAIIIHGRKKVAIGVDEFVLHLMLVNKFIDFSNPLTAVQQQDFKKMRKKYPILLHFLTALHGTK